MKVLQAAGRPNYPINPLAGARLSIGSGGEVIVSDCDVVKQVWDEQSAWSQAANKLEHEIHRSRLAALVLTVAAAICGTTSATVGTDQTAGRWLAATTGHFAGHVRLAVSDPRGG